MEVKKVVDVRGLNPKERQKIVMEESKKLETGEIIEVISDDERMPKLAPKMAEAMGNIEFINVKKENGLYHGYFKKIELIPLNKARGYVKVAKIDGGVEVKNELKKLFIEVGSTIEFLERGMSHKDFGPLIVRVDREILIPRGIADKIFVEGGKKLLDIEKGKVKIRSLEELNEDMRNGLSKIGITKGKDVEVVGHDSEKTFRFEIDSEKYELGDGETAKILVKSDEGLMQANFIKEGIVEEIIGGTELINRFGDIKGKEIKLISIEEKRAHEELGQFVTIKMRDKEIVIGRGLAEKVWVRRL